MPVAKLETFCENNPGIFIEINLKKLIRQELSNTGKRPNIVVDGSSLSYFFNSKESSYILKQPAATKLRIESFFEEIISCGANVIVVLRGHHRHPNEWFIKNKRSFLYERQKCEIIKEQEKMNYESLCSASYFCCNETLALISNKHYRAFTSVKRVTNEVVEVAVKEKCLAVLGQDSNYIIYEGIRFYISVRSLDTETFSCKFYDRNELLKCLGLKSYQLPLFATLCGNEIIPQNYLKPFHERILNGKLFTPLCVAEKVRYISNETNGHIQGIVQLIAHTKVTKKLIQTSLDMYLKFKKIQAVDELRKFALERVRKCDWSHMLYKIFVYKEYCWKRPSDFSNGLHSFELLRPLRENLYGILFRSDNVQVEEYCLEELLRNNCKTAVPKISVCKISNLKNPGVIELFQNRTPGMDILRWELFLSCISKKLRFFDVRIVPENYVFPVMALHYLHDAVPAYFQEKKVFKQAFEVEAFLLGALLLKEFPKERLENIEESEPDLWEIHLNTLYLDVCYILHLLNQACGFVISRQKACICNFYDGKVIHWIYDRMKRGATCDEFFEDNTVLEILFDTLMRVIIKTE